MLNSNTKKNSYNSSSGNRLAALRKLDSFFIGSGLKFIQRLAEYVTNDKLDIGIRINAAMEIARQLSCSVGINSAYRRFKWIESEDDVSKKHINAYVSHSEKLFYFKTFHSIQIYFS